MAFAAISANEKYAVKLQILNEYLLGIAFSKIYRGEESTFSRRQLGDPGGKCISRGWNGIVAERRMGSEEDLISGDIRGNSKAWNPCSIPVGFGVVEMPGCWSSVRVN
jgi:hypothetical protein